MMKMLRFSTLLSILFLFFVSGCATTPPPPATPIVTYKLVDTSHPDAKLILGAQVLGGNVEIIEPKLRKQGNLTQAVVTVQNLSNNTYDLEYLFEWEDESGFRIDQIKIWRPFTLTSHQIRKFNSTGTDPDAAKIIFTIRFPESKL